MSKSIVSCYTGGRGSGKTLSMSVAGAFEMLAGETVWANYPIKFDYLDEETGEIRHCESKPLLVEDLITFRPDIRKGRLKLDELNLWANCRASTSMVNRLLNSVFQLIRKRELSIDIACQSFKTLDSMIRWQTDLVCECFDLSFKYHNLKEGAYISQMITDYSGIATGHALFKLDDWDAWKRNTKTRILHAQAFWGVYDSWNEYDVLEAMTRYQVNRKTKIIGVDGDDGFGDERASFEAIRDMTDAMLATEQRRFTIEEMQGHLAGFGVQTKDNRSMGRLLKKAGFAYKQTGKGGNVYMLKEPEEELANA